MLELILENELLTFIFIICIFYLLKIIHSIIKAIVLKKQSSYKNNKSIDTTPMITRMCAEKVKKIDSNFSEEKMLAWARGLFVKIQKAWTARDLESLRLYESDTLFEQHKNQLQEYINSNRINVKDSVIIDYAYLYQFRQEGDRDILEIALKSTMKDYIIDAITKQLLEGSKKENKSKVYKMTFERKTGVLTPKETAEIKTVNCLNCGAPTEIASVGKCEYCGSVIKTTANGWVLVSLEGLRNY